MGRLTIGYVKKWRKIYQNPDIGNDIVTIGIFEWLYTNANYQDGEVNFRNGMKIFLKRGQIFVSRVQIAAAFKGGSCRLTKNMTEVSLQKLRKCDAIVTEKNRWGLIITICKYELYQGAEIELVTPKMTEVLQKDDGKMTESQHSSKKIKKEKREPNTRRPSDEGHRLALLWSKFAQEVMPWKKAASINVDAYAKAIDRMMKLLPKDTTPEHVLNFVRNDDFWRDKATSPPNLIQSRKGHRKLDTVLVQMQKAAPPAEPAPSGRVVSFLSKKGS